MLPEARLEHSIVVLVDLREGWSEARADRERWGREHTDIYPMGLDHVLLVFRPGGDSEEAAA
jgi:hypothetical protein